MATYQTTYGVSPAKGLPGQIANEEKCNKVSRTVESAAGIAFGQPAFRGAGDHGVVLGGTFAATGAGSAAASGNVGTGTITASPAITAGAKQGRYRIVLIGTSATAPYLVYDPDGLVVGDGLVATANTSIPGITTFTISNAGTMTAGDTYYIDVTYTANAVFLGLAVLNPAVPPVSSGVADRYPQYFTGAFMTMGQMYVTAGDTVVDGGDVYWDPADGRYTSTTTHVRIPGAKFDTSGGDGDIVEVSLKLR
ncbi:structural cement protein Gp24 [Ancylobacter sp.]|uniref:structural cement protein Gp24 n=1 Tax=Ancylobacter sp. TaxID=1872567 RepID=UPI003D125D7F